MSKGVFELVLTTERLRLAGDVGAVWARVDQEVGGGSTIRPGRDGVWTVADFAMRDVGILYRLED